MFIIELIYAKLEEQVLYTVSVVQGSTIEQVINQSGILSDYVEIDLSINKVGVFNMVKNLTDEVALGDRIEIYRPLIADPKDIRRKRAEKQRKEGVLK